MVDGVVLEGKDELGGRKTKGGEEVNRLRWATKVNYVSSASLQRFERPVTLTQLRLEVMLLSELKFIILSTERKTVNSIP